MTDPAERVSLAVRPALCRVGDRDLADALDLDDRFALEQKLDGIRVVARIHDNKVDFIGRNGKPVKHSASLLTLPAVAVELSPLSNFAEGIDVVLDGELVDGTFYVFDLPFLGTSAAPKIIATNELATRRLWLEKLIDLFDLDPAVVQIVKHAVTTEDKRELRAAVAAGCGEGVVYKRLVGTYQSGRRDDNWIKVKLWKEADVVVTAVGVGGKDNIAFAIYNGCEVVTIGQCSTIGKPAVTVGDVVEVKYLYLGAGGRLYQPELLRVRDDKEPHECTADQLVAVNKAVI